MLKISLLIFSILWNLCACFLRVPPTVATSTYTNVTKDWPCPLAEDIFPCTCSNDINGLAILCDNVVELSEIQRIFSKHFPFPEMGRIQYFYTFFILHQPNKLSSSGPWSHILNGQTSQRETQIS